MSAFDDIGDGSSDQKRASSSAGERSVHIGEVAGSIPASPTILTTERQAETSDDLAAGFIAYLDSIIAEQRARIKARKPPPPPKKKKKHTPGRPVARILFDRQGGKCHYCKCEMVLTKVVGPNQCTIDHVVARSRGGSNARHNKVAACYRCNNRKGDMPAYEFVARHLSATDTR